MNKATQTSDNCPHFAWCEMGWPHPEVDHFGDNDGQEMTAPIETTDRGEAAPAVLVREGQTARWTWREMSRRDLDAVIKYDIDRRDIGLYTPSKKIHAAALDPAFGAVLMWNRTKDQERGHLFMFVEQTCGREWQVIENVGWMISCGAVYATSRVGLNRYKICGDLQTRIDGDTFLVWMIPADRDVEGMLR